MSNEARRIELAAARDKLRTDQRMRLAAIITEHETRIVEMQEAIALEKQVEDVRP